MSAEASAAINRVDSLGRNGGSERDVREGAMEGVLLACGELGFRETSVRSILEHSGGHRAQFYQHFESKEDCFAQAYAVWIERLCVSVLEAAATTPGWEAGVREAIVRLFQFVTSRPAIARALFVEVQIAGEPALARHEAAVERLGGGDRQRPHRASSPPRRRPRRPASFVVGGIESCVCEALTAGDPSRTLGRPAGADALRRRLLLRQGGGRSRLRAGEHHAGARASRG